MGWDQSIEYQLLLENESVSWFSTWMVTIETDPDIFEVRYSLVPNFLPTPSRLPLYFRPTSLVPPFRSDSHSTQSTLSELNIHLIHTKALSTSNQPQRHPPFTSHEPHPSFTMCHVMFIQHRCGHAAEERLKNEWNQPAVNNTQCPDYHPFHYRLRQCTSAIVETKRPSSIC